MKKWIKRIIFWLIIICIAGFIGWQIFGPKTVDSPESYTVARGDVRSTVSINATLSPQVYANIGAETLTKVTDVNVQVGDRVAKGQILATLDRATLWSQISAAKLEVDRTVLAEQQGRRKSANLSSKQKESLKLASEQSRLRLQELYAISAKGVLTSPIEGIVTVQNARVGEVVTGTSSPVSGVDAGTVIRIIDPATLYVEAYVSESDIIDLSVGQAATMNFDAIPESTFAAQITVIDPEATSIQEVIYFKVTFELDKIDPRLRSGMSGDIDIITEQASAVLTLPLRFVSRDDGGSYVYTRDSVNDTFASCDDTQSDIKKDVVDQLRSSVHCLEENSGSQRYKKAYIETGIEDDEGMVEIINGISLGTEIYNLREDTK